MLDLKQLRYFVAVAKVEHIGKAAEELFISSSPLSRQIAQLEERLGLKLFERVQQRLRLTVDGKTFLVETRALLKHAERLESLGKRLGRGEEGGLCIGYINHAIHAGILPTAIRNLRMNRPNVHIALYNIPASGQFEGLRQRSLDIALVCEASRTDDSDLESALILRDPLMLAVPVYHKLATKEQITPQDLDDQEWIRVESLHGDLASSDFIENCLKAGFSPKITLEATEPLNALGLVASGLGFAMIQRSLSNSTPENVVLREVPWFQVSVELWVAWHRVHLRPLVAEFRKIIIGNE